MRRSHGLAILSVIAALQLASAQMDPQRDFVLAGPKVYMLLPQQFVCGPSVRDTSWSQDGQKLLVLRDYIELTPSQMSDLILGEQNTTPSEPEVQLIVWSNAAQKSTTLLKLKQSQGQIDSAQWIAGSSSMLVELTLATDSGTPPDHHSLFVLNNTGQLIHVTDLPMASQYEPIPSPTKSIVALIEHPIASSDRGVDHVEPPVRLPATVRFLGTEGVLSDRITLPSPTCIPYWSLSGFLYIDSYTRNPKTKKLDQNWFTVDRTSKKCIPCQAPAEAKEMREGRPAELTVQNLSPKLSGMKLGIHAPTVVLSSSQEKDPDLTVVSTDGSRGDISDLATGITYVSQGSVMVRPMVKVSLEAYKKARNAALKTKAISAAKQVALAMIMYCNDFDDNYPAPGSWQSQIDPYLKNSDLSSGFNYTFGGGNASNIQSPADTVLGYIDAPGGRAVAYSDGHVKWQPNP